MLGMALSGPDTGSSQWFINLSPQPHLDGTYTVFGQVVGGTGQSRPDHAGDVIRTISNEVRRACRVRHARVAALVALAALLGALAPPGRRASSSISGRTRSSTASSTGACSAAPTSTSTTIPPRPSWPRPRSPTPRRATTRWRVQFGHEVAARIPLIVYASHTDFEQTNILPFTPPEGLLGATDFLKRRVVAAVPRQLRRVPPHAAARDGARVPARPPDRELQPGAAGEPVQLSRSGGREGLAELWSGGQDARDEMVMRDLTLSGRLPQLKQLDVRHQRHRVSARRADPSLAGRHLRRLAGRADVQGAQPARHLRGGDPRGLRPHARPAERRVPARHAARVLPLGGQPRAAHRARPRGGASSRSSPPSCPTPTAGRRRGRSTSRPPAATSRSTASGWSERPGPQGRGRRAEPPRWSRSTPSTPGWTPRAPGCSSSPRATATGTRWWSGTSSASKVAGRYQFTELVSLLSPQWMPDGREHRGQRAVRERRLRPLSRAPSRGHARAAHRATATRISIPAPSPDGRRIVFASDRTAGGLEGAVNLFLLDLDKRARSPSSPPGDWVDEAPPWGPDGRVYFTSDRDGVLNVFSVDTLGEGRRETSAWSGAFDAVPLPDGSGLLVGGFHDLSWNLYRYPVDTAGAAGAVLHSSPEHRRAQWTWVAPSDTRRQRVASRRALPPAPHPRLRGGRCGLHPGLRRGAGRRSS